MVGYDFIYSMLFFHSVTTLVILKLNASIRGKERGGVIRWLCWSIGDVMVPGFMVWSRQESRRIRVSCWDPTRIPWSGIPEHGRIPRGILGKFSKGKYPSCSRSKSQITVHMFLPPHSFWCHAFGIGWSMESAATCNRNLPALSL
jgi:hypothetical protein